MIKVGDVVRIKGTKIKMTVNYISATIAETVWFDVNGILNKDNFAKEALELANDTQKT